PRRRQIWRRRRASLGRAAAAQAPSAPPPARAAAPERRNADRHGAAPGPYEGDLGFLRLCRRRGARSLRRPCAMTRAYQTVAVMAADGGHGVALDDKPLRT